MITDIAREGFCRQAKPSRDTPSAELMHECVGARAFERAPAHHFVHVDKVRHVRAPHVLLPFFSLLLKLLDFSDEPLPHVFNRLEFVFGNLEEIDKGLILFAKWKEF